MILDILEHSNLHKDAISNGRCVVPLRKELVENSGMLDTTTTQMSSQQVVNILWSYQSRIEAELQIKHMSV